VPTRRPAPTFLSARRIARAGFWALGPFVACSAPPREARDRADASCEECRSNDAPPFLPNAGVGDPSGSEGLAALCGDQRICDPDDTAAACDPRAQGGAGGGPSGVGGATSAGAGGSAGPGGGAAGGGPSGGGAGAGGADPVISARGRPAAGAGGAGGAGGTAPLACRIVRNVKDGVVKCGPVGAGMQNQVCSSSDDCAAGFSCVSDGTGNVRVCLRSCCSASTCSDQNADQSAAGVAKTSCVARRLAEGDARNGSPDPLFVPVCAPVTPCNVLLPAGGGMCAPDEVCRVVDDQGTTTCETVGGQLGGAGERCPCDEGFVCLRQSNTCRKLCPLGRDDECGPRGKCLSGGQALPKGVGLCAAD
jgi:hypothetical protein